MSDCKKGLHLGSTIYKGKCVYCAVDESNRLRKLIPQAWEAGKLFERMDHDEVDLPEWMKQKGLE